MLLKRKGNQKTFSEYRLFKILIKNFLRWAVQYLCLKISMVFDFLR